MSFYRHLHRFHMYLQTQVDNNPIRFVCGIYSAGFVILCSKRKSLDDNDPPAVILGL